jgi:hypothetical protein
VTLLRIPVSHDLTYRGIEYRLVERLRDQGASVRPMTRADISCTVCDRAIRQYSSVVLAPNANYHPACAIREHVLVAVGGPS